MACCSIEATEKGNLDLVNAPLEDFRNFLLDQLRTNIDTIHARNVRILSKPEEAYEITVNNDFKIFTNEKGEYLRHE